MKISTPASYYIKFTSIFDWMHSKLLLIPRAIWLGCLSADELNEISQFGYETLWDFWGEEFNIQHGLWQWESDVIQKYFSKKKRVLISGAGGGREVIALARMGMDVTAFDFSNTLVKACEENIKKAGLKSQILLAPPDSFPLNLESEEFEGAIIGRGFYHHIPERQRRVAFLKECNSHLPMGGHLFLSDFFTRDPNSITLKITWVTANLFRKFKKNSNPVELGDWLSYAMQHAFTKEEIETELRDAGFLLEFYAASPFSPNSHLAHAVARKL